jgi:hypothetical protein
LLGIRMRGVKLASETADVAAVVARRTKPNTAVLNAMCIVNCPMASERVRIWPKGYSRS